MSNWRILLFVVLLGVVTYSLLTWNSGVSTFVVTVSPEGGIAVDGESISVLELRQRIKAGVDEGDKVVVLIQAAPDTQAGNVVDIMEAAEAAGAAEVTIGSTTSALPVQSD